MEIVSGHVGSSSTHAALANVIHLQTFTVGGEGGIRTHVPLTGQDAFEAPPLRPLRYLSAEDSVVQNFLFYLISLARLKPRPVAGNRSSTSASSLGRGMSRPIREIPETGSGQAFAEQHFE